VISLGGAQGGPGGAFAPPSLYVKKGPVLDTKLSKIKKYPFVFHALKSFLCIYKKKELYINNLIELKFDPVFH
jgi:hypothetical protein